MVTGWLLLLAIMFAEGPGVVLDRPRPSVAQADESEPDAIVVRGLRDRRKLPTVVDAPPMVSAVRNRVRFELAERIAGCAARAKIAPLRRLAAVVDGEFNSPRHTAAQDRLRRAYITCGEGAAALSLSVPDPMSMAMSASQAGALGGDATTQDMTGAPVQLDPFPLGRSIYDRGAFTIAAMQRFAPDLTLTRAETQDRGVQERFNLREIPRNRFRLPLDRKYFETAVCMVRMAPELSVDLAMQRGPVQQSNLQAMIINRARPCVGNARSVKVDATQFRLYIADAVYRWTVAARGVGSLIPPSAD